MLETQLNSATLCCDISDIQARIGYWSPRKSAFSHRETVPHHPQLNIGEVCVSHVLTGFSSLSVYTRQKCHGGSVWQSKLLSSGSQEAENGNHAGDEGTRDQM